MGQFTAISPIQAKILSLIELAPDASAREIAEQVKARPSTVAYNLQQLKSRSIIHRSVVINPFVLGLNYVAVFFAARFKDNDRRREFVRKLTVNKQVSWLGALAGEFHFGLTFLISNLRQIHTTLGPLIDESGAELTEKLLAPRLNFSFLSRQWGLPVTRGRPSLTIASSDSKLNIDIDEIDRKLLTTLGSDAGLSGRSIASKIGLPASTTERRLASLHERGIIAGFRMSIDSAQLGFSSYRILLTAPSLSASSRRSITEFAHTQPAVVMLVESLGAWDYELLIEVQSQAELRTFMESLMDSIGVSFQRVTVLAELEDLKFSAWPM
ncbi:MAG: Lrp/AsnC family transcriptional regulator [Oligoflexia bacterium]|nr:Lrp/AsnC family transcriptional regulator [Oligoflexia bacterium]